MGLMQELKNIATKIDLADLKKDKKEYICKHLSDLETTIGKGKHDSSSKKEMKFIDSMKTKLGCTVLESVRFTDGDPVKEDGSCHGIGIGKYSDKTMVVGTYTCPLDKKKCPSSFDMAKCEFTPLSDKQIKDLEEAGKFNSSDWGSNSICDYLNSGSHSVIKGTPITGSPIGDDKSLTEICS